jgi:hypothetical protein
MSLPRYPITLQQRSKPIPNLPVQNCVRHLVAGVKVENGLLAGIRQHSGNRLQIPREWAGRDQLV